MDNRWILDDAERALLAALNAEGIGPMEVTGGAAAVSMANTTHGFDDERLARAIETLGDKGLIEPMDGGRFRMTRDGFLQAHEAAGSLKAGLIGGF